MKIVLRRHAATPGNERGCYVGSSNEELSEQGRAYAQSLAANLNVQTVYTSALIRTIQTAGILYPHAHIVQYAELNEMDFGAFELHTWKDLKDDADYCAWVDSGCENTCPGGESKALFTQRAVDAFLSLIKSQLPHNPEELHFVVHGGTIMALLSTLAYPQKDYFDWRASYCGGYELIYDTKLPRGRVLSCLQALPS